MCGRYHIGDEEKIEELREITDAINRRATDVKTRGEVFPGDVVPVIAPARDRTPGVFAMAWGYRTDGGRLTINARSETAHERPLFQDGMSARRCIVPAAHYFEWTHDGRHDKYAIAPASGGATYMAGVYRIAGGAAQFAILTRAPAEGISFIHDRMPVLLPRDRVRDWLDTKNDARELLGCAIRDVRFERIAPEFDQMRMF